MVALLLASALGAGAQTPSTSRGGVPDARPKSAPPLDASGEDANLPTGGPISVTPRPADANRRGCSFRRPLCVHAHPSVDDATAAASLAALETTYERLILALDLPAPRLDRGRGGGDELDLYLLPIGPDARDRLEVGFDPLDPWSFDTSSAFCVANASTTTNHERLGTLCLGEAIAARLSPAATPSFRRAYATHLWLSTGEPGAQDLALIEEAQSAPERSLAGHPHSPGTTAMALFLEHLAWTHGRARTGDLSTGLLAAAATSTAPGALDWNSEPDYLDVLRHTLGRRHLVRTFGSFGVARGLTGSRDDGTHLPRLRGLGEAARVRHDWVLPLSTLPRRVAASRPVEPKGTVYLWVTLDEAVTSDRLGFQAEWEAPVTFFWSLVRLGADGRELSRVDAPYLERATSVVQQLDALASATAVLVVGTNLGGVDLDHPHDPDLYPAEPSGCTIYLTPL